MSIKNLTNLRTLPYNVLVADKLLDRAIGLIGTPTLGPNIALHIVPCSGIHTFGMKYPIDVVFLDKKGKVVLLSQNLKANKFTKFLLNVKSVLELPSGSIKENNIQVGNYLLVKPDGEYRSNIPAIKNIFHWSTNLFMAALWSRFVLSAIQNWNQNGGLISLGILIINTILFFLLLTRRKSTDTSQHITDWIIPIITIASSMMLKPSPGSYNLLLILSVTIQILGIFTILYSLLSLGRSFGIIAANRKIKYSGAYKILRHPLYTSEIIFYLGFLCGNFCTFNLSLVIVIVVGQIWRTISEEKLLKKDNKYVEYMTNVKYRLLPRIF